MTKRVLNLRLVISVILIAFVTLGYSQSKNIVILATGGTIAGAGASSTGSRCLFF